MYEIQAQVLSVSGKNTSKGVVYEVAMSDGQKYAAWEPELAAKANAFQGQIVAARVDVSQKGRYTNYTLLEIALPGSLPPLATPAAPGAPVAQAPPALAAAGIPMQVQVSDFDRQKYIVRQNVLATAFRYTGSLLQGVGPEGFEAGKEFALELAKELYHKVMVADVAPLATPQAVADFVNAEAPGAVAVGVPESDAVAGARAEAATAPTPDW
jgi:hypothetical protein